MRDGTDVFRSLIGTTVDGRFDIERVAGSGGMAVVLGARDRLTGARVAMKLLTLEGPRAAERFARESALLASVSHPGIVRYVAHGTTTGGYPYLAMEWLEGQDLATRLASGPLSVRDTCAVALRVTRALGALHARGVVHRDIKPANVMLLGTSFEDAKLLDLGIARDDQGRLTQTGAALGTPAYMAPEQARGDAVLGPAADVFSLGCVVFECLTGRPPFWGEHVVAVLARILLEPAPRPSDVRGSIPLPLEALVLRMLEKDPAKRPADASDLERQIESLGDLGGSSTGTSVPPPASTRAITAAEQRMVSIVLAAPRGQNRTLLVEENSEFDREIADVAKMRGARLEHLLDGSLLVSFSSEGAATDRAEQAARAALRLHDGLPDVAVSIATGKVVVGSAGGTLAGVVSDGAVDRAARGLALAPAIAIDETTELLVGDRFDVRTSPSGRVLFGERQLGDHARTLLGRPTPCVGRDRELAILGAVLDECAGEAVARAALVVGPPGIGKSRLRHEFVRRLERRAEPITVWIARADPVGRGSPFGLVADALRGAAGISTGEPLALRQQKFAAFVARHLEGDDRDRVTEFLGDLVGAPLDDESRPRLRAARGDAVRLGDAMRLAWEDLVTSAAGRAPLVLILEDLHWGDRPTVLWIDAVLRNLRDKPLMVLATARPEVFDLFPRLWAERGLTEVHVAELSNKASERLARDVLGTGASPDSVRRIITQAAGNAFYLEELLRAAAEGEKGELPTTVIAMVHARLTSIDSDARRVLRAASVYGDVFWKGSLVPLLGASQSPESLATSLALLEMRELVTRRAQSRFPGEDEYAFRHALFREASYAMLTEQDRATGHRHAGKWLEHVGASDPMILALHFELGGLTERAIEQILRAAGQALEGNDLEMVLKRVEKGVAAGATGWTLGALRLLAAKAYRWLGSFPECAALAAQAMSDLPAGTGAWYAAAETRAAGCGKLGQNAELVAIATTLLASIAGADVRVPYLSALGRTAELLLQAGIAERADAVLDVMHWAAADAGDDPQAMGAVHAAVASRKVSLGDVPASLVAWELSAAAFLAAGDLRNASLAQANAGDSRLGLGDYAGAERLLLDALALAERLDAGATSVVISMNLGMTVARLGRHAEGITRLRAASEQFVAQGSRRGEGGARIYLAEVLAETGALAEAEVEASRALGVLGGNPPMRAHALATNADVLLRLGNVDGALAFARDALAIVEQLGTIEGGEVFVHLVHAKALERSGATANALKELAGVVQGIRERAGKIADAALRETFLNAIPDHREAIALHARLGGATSLD